MKFTLTFLAAVFLSSLCWAITVEEVVQLVQLKTDEGVILELIQKDPPKLPLDSKQVIYLKQQGVNDRIIQALLGLEEEPEKHLRTYYRTTKSGKRVQVITNLDENGNRMGPTPPEEAVYETPPYTIPPEINIHIRKEDSEREEEYVKEERQPQGIPLYSTVYSPYPLLLFPYPFPSSSKKCPPPRPAGRFRPPVRQTSGR